MTASPSSQLSPCPACARLERTRAGQDPFFICEKRESFVLLHKHQGYEGWCSVFLKDHQEHLNQLPRERQERLWMDVMDVADAITKAFAPRRLNYENLGNVVPHVHWHIIPRYDAPKDPDPGSTVWTQPEHELNCGVTNARRDELIQRLFHAGLAAPQ